MYRATADVVMPTSLIGSLPRPSWFTENLGNEHRSKGTRIAGSRLHRGRRSLLAAAYRIGRSIECGALLDDAPLEECHLHNLGENHVMIRCMPVLQVENVSRSEAYYCEKLGFKSLGTWRDGPDFGIIQSGEVTIAFDRSRSGDAIPINQYWAAYIYVEDADALCKVMRSNGVEIVREPEDKLYGSRDFDIRDPDGHLLAFGHDLHQG